MAMLCRYVVTGKYGEKEGGADKEIQCAAGLTHCERRPLLPRLGHTTVTRITRSRVGVLSRLSGESS